VCGDAATAAAGGAGGKQDRQQHPQYHHAIIIVIITRLRKLNHPPLTRSADARPHRLLLIAWHSAVHFCSLLGDIIHLIPKARDSIEKNSHLIQLVYSKLEEQKP
jgi:hypothetical protein